MVRSPPPVWMADSLSLEGPLLRVPFEALKGRACERGKTLNGELQAVVEALRTVPPGPEQAAALASLEGRLLSLRDAYESASLAEAAAVAQCCARAEHLASAPANDGDSEAVRGWERTRLDRLLADHLLRSGQAEAGAALAEAAGVQLLVDADVHAEHVMVERALRSGDAGPALAWCEAHRARLAKAGSSLEFRLRLQQFVELVRQGDAWAALRHARAQLAPAAARDAQLLVLLQRALALLAFKPGAAPPRHQTLLAFEAWPALASAFASEAAQVSGLTRVSALQLRLQAGLCALNTPHAMRDSGHSREDPLAQAAVLALAAGLPHSKHVHSRLRCPLSGAVMDEHNPPAALPNGQVYSRAALEARAQGGEVLCPRTGQGPYALDKLQKVFLA